MKYILEDLLKIRRLREDEKQKDLKVKKNELEDAIRLLEDKKTELANYIKWRINRENELYNAVINTKVTLTELDDLKTAIFILKEKDLILQKNILDAEQMKKQAEENLNQARIAYNKAFKETKKIVEHKKMWLTEIKKAEEKFAENEIEDLIFKKEMIEE
jgi:type III secretion protein O